MHHVLHTEAQHEGAAPSQDGFRDLHTGHLDISNSWAKGQNIAIGAACPTQNRNRDSCSRSCITIKQTDRAADRRMDFVACEPH